MNTETDEEKAHDAEVSKVTAAISSQLGGVLLPVGIDALVFVLATQAAFAISHMDTKAGVADFMAQVLGDLTDRIARIAEEIADEGERKH